MNFENNCLRILSCASTQATWTSATTLARECGVDYGFVWKSLSNDLLGQIAAHFRYDYRIRTRPHQKRAGYGRTYYLAVVHRGYV